ncbi:MAG: methyltransferase [Candidatus Xenobiia bacterium LiM19]
MKELRMREKIRTLEKILETGMGNCAQRALSVALKKKLFDRIGESGAALSDLASILECDARPAGILADLLVALQMLEKKGELFYLSPGVGEFLISTSEMYAGSFILMLDERLYLAWASLEEAIMNNAPLSAFPSGCILSQDESDSIVRNAIMGLHGFTTITSSLLCETVTFSPGSTHLDLGGGTGALSIAVARRFPDMKCAMIDLAPVLKVARENIKTAGLMSRIELLEGDFFVAPYPEGVSSISLSNVLQDWSREKRMMLLSRAFQALPAGGMIVIVECMFSDGHRGPLLSAMMSLNMFIETAGGECLSAGENAAMLKEAGFSDIEIAADYLPFGIVKAYKGSAPGIEGNRSRGVLKF